MPRVSRVLLAMIATPVLITVVWMLSQSLVEPTWDTHNGWLAIFVIVPFGLWLGLFAGLAWAAWDRPALSGRLALLGGIPGALFDVWFVWDSWDGAAASALRLLDPRWAGAPFLWSIAQVAFGVFRLRRGTKEIPTRPESPAVR